MSKYICKHCGKEFDNPHKLSGHVSTNHTERVPCKICGKMVYIRNMKRHDGS